MKNYSNGLEIALFVAIIVGLTFLVMPPSRDTMFIEAVAGNNTNQVLRLLRSGVNVNHTTKSEHKTVLMIAVEKRYGAMASLLIQYGADLNVVDSHGMTALDYGRQSGWTNWNSITNSPLNPDPQQQPAASDGPK
jgi:ankyrin repeat protein